MLSAVRWRPYERGRRLHAPARTARCRGRRRLRPPGWRGTARLDARLLARAGERARSRRALRVSARRTSGTSAGRGMGRDSGRARLHAAVVRVSRPSRRATRARSPCRRSVGAEPRRSAGVRGAQRDAVPGDRRSGVAPGSCASPADLRCRRVDAVQAGHARRPCRSDREGLLSGLPAGRERDRRRRLAARARMSWPRDDAKLERVRQLMAEQQLDALVARAPDNVLYLTNFWGMKGYDAVVFPRDGEPTLMCLEASEEDAARMAWPDDVRFFRGYDERDPRPPPARTLDLAQEAARGYERVGVELSLGTQ